MPSYKHGCCNFTERRQEGQFPGSGGGGDGENCQSNAQIKQTVMNAKSPEFHLLWSLKSITK